MRSFLVSSAIRPVGRQKLTGRKQNATSTRHDESNSSRFAPTSERTIASRTPSAPLASSAKHAPHRSAASPSYASTRTQGAGSNSSKSAWPCATTSSPAPRPASVRGLVTDALEQTPGRERLKRARLEASPAGDAATRAVLARARRDTIRDIGRCRCRRCARWNGRDRALGGSAGASYLPPSTDGAFGTFKRWLHNACRDRRPTCAPSTVRTDRCVPATRSHLSLARWAQDDLHPARGRA